MSVITSERSPTVATGEPAHLPRHAYVLSLLLVAVGGLTAALTFFVPDVLQGPPVTNGNARGTALVMLALATPALLTSMLMEANGSRRARFIWLGSLFYLAYNAFLLLFLTPFNSLFLLTIATESLALFSIFALVFASRGFPSASEAQRIPVRGLAIFVWVIVLLNTLAWLQVVVPAVLSDEPGSFLDGLGVATNAIYVQDLVLWLPLMATAAWWMWQRRPIGIFLTGSWLAFGFAESIGIAVDQWFGHQADAVSPHASTEVIPLMIGLALINLVGLFFYLRRSGRVAREAVVFSHKEGS
ncbi:MAG TPA: hypothetical protein VFZ80_08145 [Acidimicrobiia bacterium]